MVRKASIIASIYAVLFLLHGCIIKGDGHMDLQSLSYSNIEGFAYANIQGDSLIIISAAEMGSVSAGKEQLFNTADLTRFLYAVGQDGIVHNIKYNKYQERTVDDTGRDIALNFENRSGHVYSLTGSSAISDETYILFGKNWEDSCKLLKCENSITSPSKNLIEQCEQKAKRRANKSWTLAQYEGNMRVIMIEFEHNGDDLLAWLVIEYGGKFDYCSFPATLDKYAYTGWSIGDEGRLEEGWVFLHSAFKVTDKVILYLGWCSEEGEVIDEIVFPNNGEVRCESVCGRYTLY